jgi:hypothetical protein
MCKVMETFDKAAAEPPLRIGIVRDFYKASDTGVFRAELFVEDFEFIYPKFGRGHGVDEFRQMAAGVRAIRQRTVHHHDDFIFIESERRVVVEGGSEGISQDGIAWYSGQTPGGRFCTVFTFNDANLIESMHVHLDPDVTGADHERFVTKARSKQDW